MKLNRLVTAIAGSLLITATSLTHAETELVIATLNNGHMIEMQKHTKVFEEANPDIKIKWVLKSNG